MTALRGRSRASVAVPLCLGLAIYLLTSTGGGDQELGALTSRQSAGSERWRARVTSPFSSIRVATFGFARPHGTVLAAPLELQFASLGPADLPMTDGSATREMGRRYGRLKTPDRAYPAVNRIVKTDRLHTPATAGEVELPEALEEPIVSHSDRDDAPSADDDLTDAEIEAAARFEPFVTYDVAMSLEPHPEVPNENELDDADEAHADTAEASDLPPALADDPMLRLSRLFFGAAQMNPHATIEPWPEGEEPVLRLPPDPDLKRASPYSTDTALEARAPRDSDDASPGETIAGKGEVTGDDRRPRTPAERLQLDGRAREKAEKCLAEAVYFESRGESVRGQIAVAQVVMNRVFSGYYPDDICRAVYQNANRHLACQFTFACDGIPEVATERGAWARARRVAQATLDGKIWLPEIGKATHYHAYWVRPWWVRAMRKLHKIGVHTFYRPRKWGDGDSAPSWGGTASIAELTAKL
jgi:spore germination cell wall hydrolase CwlJ-like protein